jgi:hypothetical protein
MSQNHIINCYVPKPKICNLLKVQPEYSTVARLKIRVVDPYIFSHCGSGSRVYSWNFYFLFF